MTKPTDKRWLYCIRCGWQADEPHSEEHAGPQSAMCPECQEPGLRWMRLNVKDWMQWGAQLLTGQITVIELPSCEVSQKSKK